MPITLLPTAARAADDSAATAHVAAHARHAAAVTTTERDQYCWRVSRADCFSRRRLCTFGEQLFPQGNEASSKSTLISVRVGQVGRPTAPTHYFAFERGAAAGPSR